MQDILASQFSKNIHFGCELFPKISDDRKKAATFYTQDSTAEFLSRLVITENDLDDHQWKDEEIFKTLKIADLACGIGTLLRAGFRRAMAIRNKFLKQHEGYQSDEEREEDIHNDAMQNGLLGLDISPIAAHLTSSSLVQLGNPYPYPESQIAYLNVGTEKGLTGSLEYLDTTEEPAKT